MPHGVRGWVRLDLQGLDPDLLTKRTSWLLGSPASGWEEVSPLEFKVAAKGMLVRLRNITNRDEAELLRGRLVGVPRDELPRLGEGEYYWYDLIGLEVLDAGGASLGKVRQLLETGSNDVLQIDDGTAAGILIPYNRTYVHEVDLERGTIATSWHKDY